MLRGFFLFDGRESRSCGGRFRWAGISKLRRPVSMGGNLEVAAAGFDGLEALPGYAGPKKKPAESLDSAG